MALRWKFQTKHFRVELVTSRDHGFQYDGEDENGETQAALDTGELVAFDSSVLVFLRGEDEPIGASHLGGSVYAADSVSDFWTDHRDANPMNRNCTQMRAASPHGPRVSICHYFPGMVTEAIQMAREEIKARRDALPYIRESI